MTAFIRPVTETLTIASYLNADSNLGFGAQAPFVLFNQANFLSGAAFQPVFNQNSLGDINSDLHSIHNFVPVGRESELSARLFADNSQSSSISANFFDPLGDQFDDGWGLSYPRSLIESLTFADSVDYDGAFIRTVTETITFINRVGASIGVFFRDDFSTLVTGNSEVRLLSTVRDTGEVAVSQRPNAGSLKVLRYVPGTDISTPNTVDLGTLPILPGSQGFILDDSPHGVLLRGTWEVKLIVHDSQATGSIRLHVSLFAVKAQTSSVIHSLKIGITQVTPAFTPSLTPVQHTLNWTQAEAGEVFVADDEYLYVEVFVEEVSHPGMNAFTKFRLSDFADTIYSQMRFPGVTDEPTYSLAPPAETLVFSDMLARVVGYNRTPIESITILDVLTRSAGLVRNIAEVMSISDFQVIGLKNALVETLTISSALTSLLALERPLIENLTITDTLTFHVSASHNLIENMPITAEVSGFITRPPRSPLTDQLNKRPVDPYHAARRRNFNR